MRTGCEVENRRRAVEGVEVSPKVVDMVDPEFQDCVSVNDDMLGFVAMDGELSPRPRLVLDGRPAVDDLEEVPVDIGVCQAETGAGCVNATGHLRGLGHVPCCRPIGRQCAGKDGVCVVGQAPEATDKLERVCAP